MASDAGAITMTAAELEMRHNSGGRFRLRGMLFMQPSQPPQMAGQWPLITDVDYTDDDGPEQVGIVTEALSGGAYEAYPGDRVVVIPVHPGQASPFTQARQAVSA